MTSNALPVALVGAFAVAIAHPSLPAGNVVLMLAVLWVSWKLSHPAPEAEDTQVAALQAAVEKLQKDVSDLNLSKAFRK